MLRRNLIVVFKPIKSNSVILSESNHRLMNLSDTSNSCLNLTNNRVDHYCSWLPYGGQTIRDTEIGINANVAAALGIHEGSIVSCKVVDDVPVLDTVNVSAVNEKDWEMLEATSYRIQNTLLEQTRIVNEGQQLVIWVNKAIYISVKIDKLNPKVQYGKIENNTEFIVTPFKEGLSVGRKSSPQKAKPQTNGTKTNATEDLNGNRNSLYERLFNKNAKKSEPANQSNGDVTVIDSRTLDNVSVKSSIDKDDSDSDSDDSSYHPNNHSTSSMSTAANDNGSPPPPKTRPVRLDVQIRLFDALLTELKNQDRKSFRFRAVPRKWNDSQMCDLFLTQHNTPEAFDTKQIYVLKCEVINENDERISKEFYVNIKPAEESDTIPKNIYPTIEVNDILMAQLNMQKFSRVTLSTKKTVLNFVEKIEIIPSANSNITDAREIEEGFKRMLIKSTRFDPILINQDQVFKILDGDAIVSVRIFPESFRYCRCDNEILRDNKIFVSEQRKDLTNLLSAAEEVMDPKEKDKQEETGGGFAANDVFVHLDEFENIVNDCVETAVLNNCLDERNSLRKTNNFIIIGAQTTGKSTICKQILQKLEEAPYFCYTETFHCAQNKARKTESIQKDLRSILSRCVERAPAVLLLDNLDMLAKKVVEHAHDGEYYNRVSDVIQQLITTYTANNGITVIATIGNKNNLNQRLYTSRGNHLFQKVYKVPDLQKENRKKIIYELCQNDQVKCEKINYDKFANLTEGYTIGYLMQMVERAIFYAYRNDNKNPVITNEVLINSMKTTNAYCLQGIENNIKLNECDDDEEDEKLNKFPGLESVVSVFEEVLIWPTKYPEIFQQSPLRNQAGILLYGPPGTGKTFLVSQLSRIWNLRMISVKGPELLAKFIGQSEENVRNLFDRARSAKPCVLFFDEFDSIAPRRGHDSTGVTDRVVNQLLTELDGVEELKGVIVVAATSRPDLLDPALLRSGRIDRLVQCSLPNRESRLNIFTALAQASSLKLEPKVNFKFFCDEKSDNYTGADIKSILVSANMAAVKECLAKDPENVPDEIQISQKHLKEAFENTRPSLSYADAVKYKNLYARFMKKEQPSREFVAQRATLA